MRVPLLDLKPQYQSLKKELDEAIIKVAESQYFILGPEVTGMEKEFCDYLGCKHATWSFIWYRCIIISFNGNRYKTWR